MCSLHRAAALKRRASFSGKTRSGLLLPQHSVEPEPEEELQLQLQLPILELLSLKGYFVKGRLTTSSWR